MIRKIQTTFQLVPRCVQLRAQPVKAVARAEEHTEVRPAALLRAEHRICSGGDTTGSSPAATISDSPKGGSWSAPLGSRVIGACC